MTRITKIDLRLIDIDPSTRYKDGKIPPGRPNRWTFPLLTIHTDAGISGHSMAYGPQGDGAALAEILRFVYLPEIVGENPLNIEYIWKKLHRKQRHLYNSSASLIGVIDVALWDIVGKLCNQPISVLLGMHSKTIPAYMSARSEHYTAEEISLEAVAAKEAGYHGYKLQIRGGPAKDIPLLNAAREAVGENFLLMQDPNAAYSIEEALLVGRELDRLNFHWFEEPIAESQHANYNYLSSRLNTPLLAGETVGLFDLPNLIRNRSATMLRGDVLIKGGITGLRKAIAVSELFGFKLEIHTANTPLLDIANLHVAAATENNTFIEVHHPVFRFGLEDHPFDNIDSRGHIAVPKDPGLGVKIDWDWIENHTSATLSLPN